MELQPADGDVLFNASFHEGVFGGPFLRARAMTLSFSNVGSCESSPESRGLVIHPIRLQTYCKY